MSNEGRRLSPVEVLAAAMQEHAEYDPDGCEQEAERLIDALRRADYTLAGPPSENVACHGTQAPHDYRCVTAPARTLPDSKEEET